MIRSSIQLLYRENQQIETSHQISQAAQFTQNSQNNKLSLAVNELSDFKIKEELVILLCFTIYTILILLVKLNASFKIPNKNVDNSKDKVQRIHSKQLVSTHHISL